MGREANQRIRVASFHGKHRCDAERRVIASRRHCLGDGFHELLGSNWLRQPSQNETKLVRCLARPRTIVSFTGFWDPNRLETPFPPRFLALLWRRGGVRWPHNNIFLVGQKLCNPIWHCKKWDGRQSGRSGLHHFAGSTGAAQKGHLWHRSGTVLGAGRCQKRCLGDQILDAVDVGPSWQDC